MPFEMLYFKDLSDHQVAHLKCQSSRCARMTITHIMDKQISKVIVSHILHMGPDRVAQSVTCQATDASLQIQGSRVRS